MTTKAQRTMVTTPWGRAALVEQVELSQSADGHDFGALVQLLETDAGETLVRFAYTTGGTARRGPVTLRASDLAQLRRRLRGRRQLAAALRLGGGEAAAE
jgi:hypothetical protein